MNKKKLWMIIAGLAVLLVIGGIGAVAVYAQSPTPAAPGRHGWPGFGSGSHQLGQAELNAAAQALGVTLDDLSAQLKSGKTLAQIAAAQGVNLQTVMQAIQAARPVMLGPTELAAAAKALGMTTTDLSAELKSGKTLSEIATEKGISLRAVQAAIQAARNAQFTAQINQAVAGGKLTQDKANWLLEGLNKGYLNGPGGFGFGFGMGGMHQRPGQPATTP